MSIQWREQVIWVTCPTRCRHRFCDFFFQLFEILRGDLCYIGPVICGMEKSLQKSGLGQSLVECFLNVWRRICANQGCSVVDPLNRETFSRTMKGFSCLLECLIQGAHPSHQKISHHGICYCCSRMVCAHWRQELSTNETSRFYAPASPTIYQPDIASWLYDCSR